MPGFMHAARRHQRWVLWLALTALWAVALLPLVSHAMARAGGEASTRYTEVCTPQGMKLVALADGETAPDSSLLQAEHCHWCTPALGDAAPPPVLPAMPGFLPLPALLPAAFLHAPATAHAWASAQPRAPPTLS